jgi:hypothetical protein
VLLDFLHLSSPFTWKLISRREDVYQVAYRIPAGPIWRVPRFELFRRFAANPALSRIDDGQSTCVGFTLPRCDLPVMPDVFRYGLCREGADQPWPLHRLPYLSKRLRQRLRHRRTGGGNRP